MNDRPAQPRVKPRAAAARRRRGSAYLAVVGVSLSAAAICTGALAVVRSQTRGSDTANDAADARLYALAAIEMGRYIPIKDSNWRTNYPNGTWVNPTAFGSGTLQLDAVNANGGAMNASSTDPVVLTGIGVRGNTRQMVQVTLTAESNAATCLQTALTANGNISTGIGVTYAATGMTLATNGSFTATSSQIRGTVQAAGSASGGTYTPAATGGAAARTMPDPATVFSFYTNTANAVTIPVSTLTNGTVAPLVSQKLLTPTVNTFPSSGSGTTNPGTGIYVIDCGNRNITIRDCRIVGTLVLLNTGSGSQIGNNVSWVPHVSNYPCLMVKGFMTFAHTSTNLTESTANFNPPGTPPALNGTNNTSASGGDSYPAGIRGLVYVSGSVVTTGSPTIWMLMGNSTVTTNSSGTLTFAYDPTYANNPPPGFGAVKMVVQPGQWVQAVQP